MYDKDDSGTIELSEMTDIIGTLYDMEGVTSSGGEGNISKPKIWFIVLFKMVYDPSLFIVLLKNHTIIRHYSTSNKNIFRIRHQW